MLLGGRFGGAKSRQELAPKGSSISCAHVPPISLRVQVPEPKTLWLAVKGSAALRSVLVECPMPGMACGTTVRKWAIFALLWECEP